MRTHREEFVKLLLATAELFDKQLSPIAISLYYETLVDYPFEEVRAAFAYAIKRECRFFPRPAEIVEIIEGSPETRAELAWQDVLKAIREQGGYRSVVFDDTVITAAIKELGFTWGELCEKKAEDLKFIEHRFKRHYRECDRKRKQLELQTLPGITEAENRIRGFLDHIPEPVLIQCQTTQKDKRLALKSSGEKNAVIGQVIKVLPKKIKQREVKKNDQSRAD